MRSMFVRSFMIWLLVMSMIVLNACTSNEEEPIVGNLHVVLMGPNVEHVRLHYTELFQAVHPELDIEVTDMFNTEIPNKISSISEIPTPDIIISFDSRHQELVQAGLLESLESIWEQTKLEEEWMVPVLFEQLRNLGNGQLYGLTPTFTSEALAYNKNLFDEAGVPEPTDGLSWDEVFVLSERIAAADQEIRGFSFSRYSGGSIKRELYEYFDLHGLQIVSATGQELTVNSDSWKDQWRKLADLSIKKVLHRPLNMDEMMSRDYLYSIDDLFIDQSTAMILISSSQLSNLSSNMQSDLPAEGQFEWDIVTMPAVVSAPDTGGNINPGMIFSIYANAENRDNAYQFIEYIHGEAWAKLQPKNGQLLTFKSHNAPILGLEYDPSVFYRLKPQNLSHQAEDDLTEIKALGYDLFMEVLRNEKIVDEALLEWESEGNLLLQQDK